MVGLPWSSLSELLEQESEVSTPEVYEDQSEASQAMEIGPYDTRLSLRVSSSWLLQKMLVHSSVAHA